MAEAVVAHECVALFMLLEILLPMLAVKVVYLPLIYKHNASVVLLSVLPPLFLDYIKRWYNAEVIVHKKLRCVIA